MVHRRFGRGIRRLRQLSRKRQAASRAQRLRIAARAKPRARTFIQKTRPIARVFAGVKKDQAFVGSAAGLGGSGIIKAGGGFIRGVGAKLEKFGKPVTFKSGIKKVGSRFLKGLGIVTGITAIESAITGEPFNPLGRRPLLGAFGFGIGGLPAAAIGTFLGGGKKVVSTAIELGGTVGAALPPIPFVPEFPSFGGGGSNIVNIDLGEQAIQTPLPVIGAITPAGASFSADIGGGGGDLSSLALLLLLGVGGGALLGKGLEKRKEKKKKKKKKKRKKLKRKLRELDE